MRIPGQNVPSGDRGLPEHPWHAQTAGARWPSMVARARWPTSSRDTRRDLGVASQLWGRGRLVWAVAGALGGMRYEGAGLGGAGVLGVTPAWSEVNLPVAASPSSSVRTSHLDRQCPGRWEPFLAARVFLFVFFLNKPLFGRQFQIYGDGAGGAASPGRLVSGAALGTVAGLAPTGPEGLEGREVSCTPHHGALRSGPRARDGPAPPTRPRLPRRCSRCCRQAGPPGRGRGSATWKAAPGARPTACPAGGAGPQLIPALRTAWPGPCSAAS